MYCVLDRADEHCVGRSNIVELLRRSATLCAGRRRIELTFAASRCLTTTITTIANQNELNQSVRRLDGRESLDHNLF